MERPRNKTIGRKIVNSYFILMFCQQQKYFMTPHDQVTVSNYHLDCMLIKYVICLRGRVKHGHRAVTSDVRDA